MQHLSIQETRCSTGTWSAMHSATQYKTGLEMPSVFNKKAWAVNCSNRMWWLSMKAYLFKKHLKCHSIAKVLDCHPFRSLNFFQVNARKTSYLNIITIGFLVSSLGTFQWPYTPMSSNLNDATYGGRWCHWFKTH